MLQALTRTAELRLRQIDLARRAVLHDGQALAGNLGPAHTDSSGTTRSAALQGQAEQIHSGLSSDLALLPDEQRAAMLGECEAELATRRDAHYLQTALAISLTTFAGFWFTYFGPHLRGTYTEAAVAVHVHGWSFFGWYLLLPLQAGLIHARRVRLHRTLGLASVALATLMVTTGLLVIGVQMQAASTAAEPTFFALFGPMIFATLVLFAGFYVAALRFRRNGAYHKRLVLVASAAGMGAAVFRLLGALVGPVSWGATGGMLATNLFIVWGMVHDLRRERRIHPAYQIGLAVCVALELAAWLLTPTPVGQALAHGLAWVGRTFAFLY